MSDSALAQPAPTKRGASSTIDAVFETILRDIITGVYAPGARLPAERELSRTLGASRPTLREALRRLSEWRLVEPRRGSGIVVRPISEWSIEVLPAFVRHAQPLPMEPSLAGLLRDLLALRRSLMVEIVRLVAERVPPGGTAGGTDRARSAAQRAWEAREDPERFRAEDLEVLRSLLEAARFFPGLWLMNRLAEVYLQIARSFPGDVQPPAEYLEIHQRLLDALDQGDGAAAVTVIQEYLDDHDRRLMALVGDGP